MTSIWSWMYSAVILCMAVYGLHLLLLGALASVAWLRRAWRPQPAPAEPVEWPSVLVQLPLYNERQVAERLIDAAVALDYPADRLVIQVLDDSTDDTTLSVQARAEWHRARGRDVRVRHRRVRAGFKAGALAEGLAEAPGELVAVFDADFIPPPDFLRRLLPFCLSDPRVGLIQGRWEHLNPDQNFLTQAETLALDSYFAVDQVARSTYGLLLNFNGSAGVWRRACIEAAGGWQGDTLAEDLDLSYRAQIAGWRLAYTPAVSAPAELPATLAAFKQQQARWAQGSFQVFFKLFRSLWAAPVSAGRKVLGSLHLSSYLPHGLMVAALLLSLPVVLVHGRSPVHWGLIGLAGLGLPLSGLLGQLGLRRRPWRLVYYPVLVLVGIGLAAINTRAILRACLGRRVEFLRTPKGGGYTMPVDGIVWFETALALYGLGTGLLALGRAPDLAPLVFLYTLGFGLVAVGGLWDGLAARVRIWKVGPEM